MYDNLIKLAEPDISAGFKSSPSIKDSIAKLLVVLLSGAHLGGTLGALPGLAGAPKGKRTEGLGRGVARGAGMGAGAFYGLTGAQNVANMLQVENPWAALGLMGAGGIGGGIAGDVLTRGLIGRPTWETEDKDE